MNSRVTRRCSDGCRANTSGPRDTPTCASAIGECSIVPLETADKPKQENTIVHKNKRRKEKQTKTAKMFAMTRPKKIGSSGGALIAWQSSERQPKHVLTVCL